MRRKAPGRQPLRGCLIVVLAARTSGARLGGSSHSQISGSRQGTTLGVVCPVLRTALAREKRMNRRHFARLGKGLRVAAAVGPTVLVICITILGMGMVYSISGS